MTIIITGLGNPGEEYKDTRHNAGRMVVTAFAKAHDMPEFVFDKKLNALTTKGKVTKKTDALLVLPETFMNKSGSSLKSLVTSKKKAESLVVVHDDMDLPLGTWKISFNKSSGGHKGVESIIRQVKTQEFIRVRIGITPATASGKLKKPVGDAVIDGFITEPFKKSESESIAKAVKIAVKVLDLVVEEGREKAMSKAGML